MRILHVRSIIEKVIAAAQRFINLSIYGVSEGPDFSQYNNGYIPCYKKGQVIYNEPISLIPIDNLEKAALKRTLTSATEDNIKIIIAL